MLHLINNNKGGKNFNAIAGGEIHWKALFKISEDSLTSSVFGLLFYLPIELFWSIVHSACYSKELPKQCGKLLGYEFWPRWENEKETYTEPDILLQFEEFNLIVEAKRYDHNQQKLDQWIAETRSYYRSQFHSDKKLYLLAVGGISDGDEQVTSLREPHVTMETLVIKTRWSRLLHEIIRNRKEIAKADVLLHSSSAILNILNDLILSFRIHGFITAELLNTLPINLRLSRYQLPKLAPFPVQKFRWKAFLNENLFIQNNSIQIISNYNEHK
jgi:hypothetical protein